MALPFRIFRPADGPDTEARDRVGPRHLAVVRRPMPAEESRRSEHLTTTPYEDHVMRAARCGAPGTSNAAGVMDWSRRLATFFDRRRG